MRGIPRLALAGLVLPVAGGIAALAPRVHVVSFSPTHDVLRIHRSVSTAGDFFQRFVETARPAVAFNGTYYGEDGTPLGILRAGGKWVFKGGHMRTTFAVDRRGKALLTTRDEVRRNPSQYPFAVAAGPRLLKNGKVCLNPEAEGFRPAARRVRASRVALGVKRDGTGVAIVDEDAVTLAEFATLCREAGAVDAVNLDGGGATGLYQNGKTVVSPYLPMADVITISRK